MSFSAPGISSEILHREFLLLEQEIENLRTLYWLDQDLRLDDNPALDYAAAGASTLLCVYCLDASREGVDSFGTRRQAQIRKRFIAQSLAQLSSNLRPLGQAVLQVSGSPTTNLRRLIVEHRIQRVVRSRQFGVFENRQWEKLRRHHPSIDFVEIDGYTLFTREQIMRIGDLPETFSKFRRQVERLSLIHISEPTRRATISRMPSSA